MYTVPDSPENISALPLSSSSILVYWLPPLHPAGQVTGYCLHVKTMIGGNPVAARHQVKNCPYNAMYFTLYAGVPTSTGV